MTKLKKWISNLRCLQSNGCSEIQKGSDDFNKASDAWDAYKAASEEIIQLSTKNQVEEASQLMIGDVYEKYKLFGEKFNVLRNDFQVKLEQSKAIASICINIIFICSIYYSLFISC